MSVRTIIALAGRAGAGKDTTAQLLVEAVMDDMPEAYVIVAGFADRLKNALTTIFKIQFHELTREEKEAPIEWLGKSPRELMQTLGTEWGRSVHPDLWIQLLDRELFDPTFYPGVIVIIPDCRFKNEVAWVRAKGGAVWWIERDGIAPVAAHSSENAIGAMDCDRTIANLGTIDDLDATVARAWAQHAIADLAYREAAP